MSNYVHGRLWGDFVCVVLWSEGPRAQESQYYEITYDEQRNNAQTGNTFQ